MDRRGLLKAITGLTAAVGITAEAKAVESTSENTLLFGVLESPEQLSHQQIDCIRHQWQNMFAEGNAPKLMICTAGMTFTPVYKNGWEYEPTDTIKLPAPQEVELTGVKYAN